MLTQDDNAFAMFSCETFEANSEIDFFTSEEFFAEAANFTKGRGFAKYERSGHEGKGAADSVPKADNEIGFWIVAIEFNGAAASHAFAGGNLLGTVRGSTAPRAAEDVAAASTARSRRFISVSYLPARSRSIICQCTTLSYSD